MPVAKETFVSLGRKYLGENGPIFVKIFLKRRSVYATQILLLGAMDRAWFSKRMTYEAAKKDYKLLGLDMRMIHRIRQRRDEREVWLAAR